MAYDLIVGALLHDIGKLIQRARPADVKWQKVKHQELGAAWAKDIGLGEAIYEIILRHHALKSTERKFVQLSSTAFSGAPELQNYIYLVDEGDNIAAGMERRQFFKSGKKFQWDVPLRTVFDLVDLKGEPVKTSNFWTVLPLSKLPYPVTSSKTPLTNYTVLWNGFHDEVLRALPTLNEETLLTLLQKYLFCIAEHTNVIGEFPDTSLYHHSKTTAAVAYCNYLYLAKEKEFDMTGPVPVKEIRERKTHKYLLITADLSGIQKFIYTLTSHGALKTLRGRSFYLNLLQESIATQFLDRFQLPRSCLIHVGGGGFSLLAPNLSTIRDQFPGFPDDLNKQFFNSFGTAIYLTMGYEQLTGDDLTGETSGLRQAWENLPQQLNRQKSRKWYPKLSEEFCGFFKPTPPPRAHCLACHGALTEEQPDGLCLFCGQMVDWGRRLADIEQIYQVEPGSENGRYLTCGGYYYSFEPGPSDKTRRIYLIKEPWGFKDFRFPTLNFFQGTYYTEPDFDKLVKESTGIQRLGVLRLDLDQLSRIFGRGLPEHKFTFARLNDLSERLNLYFNFYLPQVLARVEDEKLFPSLNRNLKVNLIYAGGDDLFLVGAWDSALETAWRIYADFSRFVAGNPSFTLSGGIVLADEKISFHKLADLAGEAENQAKLAGRNCFTLLGKVYRWDQIKTSGNVWPGNPSIADLLALFETAIDWSAPEHVKPIDFSRSFIHKLLGLALLFESHNDLWVFPRLHYYLARVMVRSKKPEFYRSLLAVLLNRRTLKEEMIPALQIIDYLTRGGSKDE